MRERTLCERLMASEEGSIPHSGKLDRGALFDSILRNLREILNSHSGCCEIRRDYGMPDFNDLAGQFPDAIQIITRSIKMQIENFEPRLSNVAVRHIPDPENPLGFSFSIGVTLDLDDGAERLNFQTDLSDDGKLRVHG